MTLMIRTSTYAMLMLLGLSVTSWAQLKMDLELVPPVGKATLCEPIKLRIAWQNISDQKIAVGESYNPAKSSAVSLLINGKAHRLPLPGTPLEVEDQTGGAGSLKPGQKFEGEIDVATLDLPPGEYRFQAVARLGGHSPGSSPVKDSAIVTLTLEPARGVDLKALEYQKEHFDRDDEAAESSACSMITDREDITMMGMLLSEFPDSIYAAWIILPSLYSPDAWDPGKVKEFVATASWPLPNSVPDPASPGGWKKYQGAELARWQVEWVERILKNHPDFAYADRLKLVLAVDRISLGDNKAGTSLLEEIAAAKESSREGAWAKQFLALSK